MVTNSAALTKCSNGPDGLLAGVTAGKIVIDMSTVSPAISRRLAERVREKGGDMVDAPVSGSIITLQQGKLSVMVGGRAETFDKLKPMLRRHRAEGDARRRKRARAGDEDRHQSQPGRADAGVLRRRAARRKKRHPARRAVDVLTHSVIASPMVQYRGPFVLKMVEEAWFNVNMMQKDMLLAMELGRQLDVPLPTTAATNEMLTAARAMGLAKYDFAIIFEALARMSGVKTGLV